MDTILKITVIALALGGCLGVVAVYGFTGGYGKGPKLALRLLVASSSLGFVLAGAHSIYRDGLGVLQLAFFGLALSLPVVLRRELFSKA